jgi:hypothetical protein
LGSQETKGRIRLRETRRNGSKAVAAAAIFRLCVLGRNIVVQDAGSERMCNARLKHQWGTERHVGTRTLVTRRLSVLISLLPPGYWLIGLL